MAQESVLIVDDEEDILQLVSYNLARDGYKVRCTADGDETYVVTGLAPGADASVREAADARVHGETGARREPGGEGQHVLLPPGGLTSAPGRPKTYCAFHCLPILRQRSFRTLTANEAQREAVTRAHVRRARVRRGESKQRPVRSVVSDYAGVG
jgi:hypothetical protein